MLSKETLQPALTTELLGKKLFVFESIDSTNSCARTLAQAGMEEGVVVVAEHQTSGKGRQGRIWHAAPNENLLFSVVLRPHLPHSSAGFLTFFAAVSVAQAVEQFMQTAVECKWPNDLLLNGRKLSGILLENSIDRGHIEYSVVGIGINVNQRTFPPPLAATATSLVRELSRPVDRVALFSSVLNSMEAFYRQVQAGHFEDVLAQWNARCSMFGREVTISEHDHRITGTAVGLNHDGGLLLRTSTGTRTIYAGDISLHPQV